MTPDNPKPQEFSPMKKIKLEKLKTSKVGGEGGSENFDRKVGIFRQKVNKPAKPEVKKKNYSKLRVYTIVHPTKPVMDYQYNTC